MKVFPSTHLQGSTITKGSCNLTPLHIQVVIIPHCTQIFSLRWSIFVYSCLADTVHPSQSQLIVLDYISKNVSNKKFWKEVSAFLFSLYCFHIYRCLKQLNTLIVISFTCTILHDYILLDTIIPKVYMQQHILTSFIVTYQFHYYHSLMRFDVLWLSEFKIAIANPFCSVSWNILCCKVRFSAHFIYIKYFRVCHCTYHFWAYTFHYAE